VSHFQIFGRGIGPYQVLYLNRTTNAQRKHELLLRWFQPTFPGPSLSKSSLVN